MRWKGSATDGQTNGVDASDERWKGSGTIPECDGQTDRQTDRHADWVQSGCDAVGALQPSVIEAIRLSFTVYEIGLKSLYFATPLAFNASD